MRKNKTYNNKKWNVVFGKIVVFANPNHVTVFRLILLFWMHFNILCVDELQMYDLNFDYGIFKAYAKNTVLVKLSSFVNKEIALIHI